MSFVSGAFLFALAGAIGPLVIHLLNKRRQRTVDWAAMELLLQAIRQQRRRLQLRDLLLLLLRTLAIVCFVLAMAQPVWRRQASTSAAGQPVHAVIVLDNSLSMAYTPLDKSLLDLAREKVEQFLHELPSGSDVTLIPMCAQADTRFAKVYDSREDSLESLARIRVVDRLANLDDVSMAIQKAVSEQGTVVTKRIVLVSDLQRRTWAESPAVEAIAQMGDVQLVEVGRADSAAHENSWIESCTIRGGFAESGVPTIFDVVIQHQAEEDRHRVRASLSVDGKVVQENQVDLAAGQRNTISFEHVFEKPGGDFNPTYRPVTVEIEPDRLIKDDQFSIVVPVFRQAPILFVDQYGSLEEPASHRLGETYLLRHLIRSRLAGASGTGVTRPPHLTIDQLDEKLLADARLVVIAGVRSPSPETVQLLRTYVERGGQLLITAGGEFQADEWSTFGYDPENGIMPMPLASRLIGGLPATSVESTPRFHLDFESLRRDVLNLSFSEEHWGQLLRSAFFYQAVRIDPESASKEATDQTQVIARYDNGQPFALLRQLGQGNVMFITTGCYPKWNNLAVTQEGGIFLFDQLLKWLVSQSISTRTFSQRQELVVPVDPRDQNATFKLDVPGREKQNTLAVEAVGENEFALVIRDLTERGVYTIQKDVSSTEMPLQADAYRFAVNGPSQESDLTALDRSEVAEDEQIALVSRNQAISLTGGTIAGQNLWVWLMALALLCLFAEMAIAAAPPKGRQAGKEAA